MADSFTLFDHLAPYISPCLPFCGSSRRITLVASPQLRPRAIHDDILDDGDDEADLYSLHSRVGRASSSAPDHLAGEDSATMTLSRWQLLRSWWTSLDARRNRGTGRRDGRHLRGHIFLETELDADAEELVQPAPPDSATQQPRQPSRQPVLRIDADAPRPRSGDALSGMEQGVSVSHIQTGTQESKRPRQAPERRHSRTPRSRPSGSQSQRSRSTRSDASSAASTLASYPSSCSPPLSPSSSGADAPLGGSCDIEVRKERRRRQGKRSSRRASHAGLRPSGTGYGEEDQYEDETGYSQSTAPTSVLEEDSGARDLAEGKSGVV